MPALLSVEKRSLGNDTLYMAVCYYFQMNGILLIGYLTYRNLKRLWNLPTASGDRFATGRSKWPESPGWCSADCHSSRRPRGPRPRCERGRASSRPSTTGPAAWGAQLSVCKSRLTATSEPSGYLHWNALLMKYPFDFMWRWGLSMPQTCRKHRILFTLLLLGKGWGE